MKYVSSLSSTLIYLFFVILSDQKSLPLDWPWHFFVPRLIPLFFSCSSKHQQSFSCVFGFLVTKQLDSNRTGWMRKRALVRNQKKDFHVKTLHPSLRGEHSASSSLVILNFLSSTRNFTKTSSCHKKTVEIALQVIKVIKCDIFHHNKPYIFFRLIFISNFSCFFVD